VTPKQQTEKRGRRAYRAHGGYRARSEKQGSSKSAGSLQPSNRESTTIDIVNIPLELNTIDKLHEHFKKFGQIINIQVARERRECKKCFLLGTVLKRSNVLTSVQVMPDKGKAQIQFSTKTEARAAMRSTEAVLNNRFIKIYWAREQKETDVTEQKKATEELKVIFKLQNCNLNVSTKLTKSFVDCSLRHQKLPLHRHQPLRIPNQLALFNYILKNLKYAQRKQNFPFQLFAWGIHI
jgi:RNA recognition motif-containing protein